MQYLKKFWSNNITENLFTQTNIYLVQRFGKCIDRNALEIERFICIQMLMSIISLPSYELYWSKDLHVDFIANAISLKRYELIRRYQHVNDNTEKKEDSSRLFKVKPVVRALSTTFVNVEQERYQSIDKFTNTYQDSQVGIYDYFFFYAG